MTSFPTSNEMVSVTYPRTGKRGVPQQFPRRLSEMLESEAQCAKTDPNHKDIISWSDSGKAFRILNVSLFSFHILPKYFRTSKFSSFQRNLNLVRFVRRKSYFIIASRYDINEVNLTCFVRFLPTVWFLQGSTRPRY